MIVARPLVLGEDPGLSAPQSDASSMVLSLLWLVAGVGWASWRLWAKRSEWYVGIVEAALGIAVVFIFISAETAANKHPARIIAWEWLILLVGFVVVRHLAATPDARHGLFTAFLATGLMVATYGIYQAVTEIPTFQRLTKAELRSLVNSQGMRYDDPTFDVLYQRVQDGHAYGPFAHPNSFAGYLVLLLPGLVGAVIVCLRNGAGARMTRLAATAAVLGLAALWVTHSRGGLLALAVVGLGGALIFWRRQLLAQKKQTLVIAAIGVVGLTAVLLFVGFRSFGKNTGTMAARLDYWRATAQMIAAQPCLGTGPGNFGGYYPRYMAETAGEKIKDPHNFVLELWATGGIFVLAAMLVALGGVFWYGRAACGFTAGSQPLPPAPSPARGGGVDIPVPPARTGKGTEGLGSASAESSPVRWEYYAGGVLGLLLAFALRMTSLHSPDQILQEGLTSAVRSLVWFLAFALLERILWTDQQRAVALLAGVAALLLNLCVSGGIGAPSIVGPLWIAGALALASMPLAPRVFPSAPLPSLGLPVPASIALAWIYLVFCFYPVTTSLGLLREAEHNASYLVAVRGYLPAFCAGTVVLSAPGTEGSTLATLALLHAKNKDLSEWAVSAPKQREATVLRPLLEAAQVDPINPRVWTQLGVWYGQDWEFSRKTGRIEELGQRAGGALDRAESYDPNALEPLLAEVQLRLLFARYSNLQADVDRRKHERLTANTKLSTTEKEKALGDVEKDEKRSRDWAADHLRKAAIALRKAVKLDPTDAPLRYQLADMLDKAGDRESCRKEAQEALRLDNVSTMPPRRLTDPQRLKAEAWADAGSRRF